LNSARECNLAKMPYDFTKYMTTLPARGDQRADFFGNRAVIVPFSSLQPAHAIVKEKIFFTAEGQLTNNVGAGASIAYAF
jgi:hypothetical protein